MSFRGAPRGRGTGANFGGRGGFGARGGGGFGGEICVSELLEAETDFWTVGRGGYQQSSGPPDQVLGEYGMEMEWGECC